MISTFPKFTKITIDLQDEIVSYTRKFNTYADFTFVNLFSWNVDNEAGVAWLNGNLVIKIPDYVYAGEHTYSILGDKDLDESLKELFGEVKKLSLVPEIVIDNLKHPEIYAIAEDRDSFDYLYKVDDLCTLNGGKLKNKRQKVNQTLKHFGERISFDTVTTPDATLKQEMLAVLKTWQGQTSQPAEHVHLEEIALKRLLEHFDHFKLLITTMRLDDELQGFSINEVIDKDKSICHFEKSITKEHNGMYAVLINEAAKALKGKSKVVNWEQDLGIPGLKHIKRSYAPFKYYRKYWIHNGNGHAT